MKRITILCLTAFLCFSTFAGPAYLLETGEDGDATWSVSIDGATKVNLHDAGKTLNEWMNETFTSSSSADIWLAAGTYALNGSISVSYSSIRLYGGFQGNETKTSQRSILGGKAWDMRYPTIIDGGSTYQICSANFNGTWDGLKFQNGTGENGGVARIYTNAKVRACAFVNNSSTSQGGALYTYRASGVQILNCYFEGNSAPKGGAICVSDNDVAHTYEIDHCYFKDNNATGTNSGGAVRFENPGTYTVKASVFDHNNGAGNGTAIAAVSTGDGVYTTISNCLIKNQQNDKVAVLLYQGALLNNTFAHNAGGVLYMGSTDLSGRIENNIIWGDTEDECKISMRNTSSYTLKNNALFKMIDPSNVDKSDNKRLYASESDYFVDEANGDYHLSWKAKKMIGKGRDLSSVGITTDLEGNPRSANDIGCYASPWEIASRSVEASAYGTWCTPKSVNVGEFEGATFYRIAGTASGGSELAIETVDALEAGHSYIFESTSTLIRLNLTGDAALEPIADNGLYGTYHTIENLETYLAEQSIAYNQIYVVYDGEIRRAGTNLEVPAKRAWIKLDEVRDAATEPVAPGAVRKRIPNASYVPTALEEVSEINGTEAIYDLLGRHVTTPVMGGVYIVNGKKIIIK